MDKRKSVKPTKAKWMDIGKLVTWTGQTTQIVARIVSITEPQPGNYVLWTKCDTDPKGWEPFPINYRQVKPLKGEL